MSNSPNQTLTTSLNVDGVVTDYQLTLRYNEVAGYWVMSVSDAAGNLILDSIPLVTGNAPAGNILGQFAYLGIGSAYIINAGGVKFPEYPNNIDLGSDFVLIWGDTPTASGSVLQEVSEGFGIASLQVRSSPSFTHFQLTITVTLGGPSDLTVGSIIRFNGLTNNPWLNGGAFSIVSISGPVLVVLLSSDVSRVYGPAAETGTVTPI